ERRLALVGRARLGLGHRFKTASAVLIFPPRSSGTSAIRSWLGGVDSAGHRPRRMLMHLSRVLPALVTTFVLCLALASAASSAPTGVTAATAGELTGICDDLFGDVYDTPSGEPLAVCQWDMAVIDADASARSRATG